jgi:hypothetical protein
MGKLMAIDKELTQVIESLENLETRFIDSKSLGLHLSVDDGAKFKRLAIEAKSMLSSELGALNDFSSTLFSTINNYSGGYLDSPSLASVKNARELIQGGLNQIRMKSAHSGSNSKVAGQSYIDTSRLSELRNLTSSAWDLTRLIRLAEELNVADANRCYMSIAMLARAISDHVPPIFSLKSFTEVANNYPGAPSFRKSMANLNNSLRNIADAHLHVQIRQSEVLPTLQQVDFKADLDALLAEIVRILK